MDKVLRTSLRTVVAACRQVLEEDVRRQLEGTYGVTPRGEFIAREDVEPYAVDVREWRREREEILAAIAHIESYGADRGHAVEQFVRESAFTVLNRLAALKLMEHPSRGLIPESVGRGKDSKGFALFQKISPEVCRAARNGPVLDSGFRLFFESIFDDLADELGVLFDRRFPQSIIFPSEACLKRVLNFLNQTDVATVWSDDETIGWIYQYFIPKELRDEARKASQAPRNSYELAFRNQFFTPRYVVEFLVDNTLGRIWYEMRRGETRLVDACKYLIRGTGDAFLEPGVTSPTNALAAVSIESSFRRLNHVPHRPKKDPRDLRLLDPACGSGHFLLYAYDLLETIYVEAWDDAEGPSCEETGRRLRDDYPEREAMKRAIPELIVGHNLHGIDIDLRATQIAALAMWLRAQRSYQEQGFKVSDRPRIMRSNIVCAEPMPGERELLEEFVATIQPKLLGQLVRVVFDKMTLAGEAGSLLPIEEEIRGAVAEAKRQWQAGPQPEQLMLFPVAQRRSEQLALFDVRGITNESFWNEAEGRVVESLHEYARKAANGRSYRRRLFVEDATQGFAFIDIASKRYDVVLMNPPFGDASLPSLPLLDDQLARCGRNIGPAFVAAASDRWAPDGYVGVLLSTAPLFQPSTSRWRGDHLLGHRRSLAVAAQLGGDVLDEAKVGASAMVTRPTTSQNSGIPFFRLLRTKDRQTALLDCIGAVRNGDVDRRVYFASVASLGRLPGRPVTYWISDGLRERLASLPKFDGAGGTVKQGTATADEFRFSRAWWEVAGHAIGRKWMPFAKGSEYSPFWDDPPWVVNFANDGEELRASGKAVIRNPQYYGRPGVTFPSRSVPGFNPRVHPSGSAFSHTGAVAFPASNTPQTLLGYLTSRPVEYVLSLFVGSLQGDDFHPNHYEVGLVSRIPWPGLSDDSARALASAAEKATRWALGLFEVDETAHHFLAPFGLDEASLESAARAWRTRELETVRRIDAVRTSTDAAVADALGFSPRDVEEMTVEFDARVAPSTGRWRPYFGAETDAPDARDAAEALLSYAVGVAFGRWDVRLALDSSLAPQATDPFDALPVCSPGMLVGPDGLPARTGAIVSRDWLVARRKLRELPSAGSVRKPIIHDDEYPVRVDWDGVLVDDDGNDDDIVHQARGVIELLFKARAGEIEAEACRVLGSKELRDYFRNPRGFFDHHIKRYSKSRRKAPIFWLLQSSKKAYGLWIYYPRLDRDTCFKALRNYVEPKIKGEAARLKELKGRLEEGRETLERRERSKLEKEIERQDALLGELGAFKESLERVSALGYEPDLDDGVVLNIAPFHEQTPWKEARAYWKELLDGGYAWSTIAKRLRARKVAATPPRRSERHG